MIADRAQLSIAIFAIHRHSRSYPFQPQSAASTRGPAGGILPAKRVDLERNRELIFAGGDGMKWSPGSKADFTECLKKNQSN